LQALQADADHRVVAAALNGLQHLGLGSQQG
jgi:hypothetical protein